MEPFRQHTGIVVAARSRQRRYRPDHPQAVPEAHRAHRLRPVPVQRLALNARRQTESGVHPQPAALQGRSILLAAKNFGCGSSREHAPWALADYGFRAVIAPSFADIFSNNCAQERPATVVLTEPEVNKLMKRAKETEGYQLTIDLE